MVRKKKTEKKEGVLKDPASNLASMLKHKAANNVKVNKQINEYLQALESDSDPLISSIEEEVPEVNNLGIA